MHTVIRHPRLETRIFLRSLGWQASWNYARMQGLGLAYAIYPLLEQRYGSDGEPLRRQMKKYLGFFNTNPVMAAAVLGILVNFECHDRGDEGLRLATTLNSLYGAVGDAFFWGGIKPLTAVMALLCYVGGGGWWAPATLLIGYNLVHLGIRWYIYQAGVHHGFEVVELIHRWQLPRVKIAANYLTIVLLGVMVPVAAADRLPALTGSLLPQLGAAGMVIGGIVLLQRKMSLLQLVLAGALLAIILVGIGGGYG
ncbi:MAG: PTS mannose/fructose/sorbose transporter family subunit IID [Deltaproteobacteria bacterium]|nr:PTS mannose/fructose/sorbose transporter family subunit IID [Candidatus Anaeroferrophillacea bacterium]